MGSPSGDTLVIIASTVLAAVFGHAAGHSAMVWPPIWQDQNGRSGLKAGQQCWKDGVADGINYGGSCMWFTNFTFIQGKPTLDESMRTFKNMDNGYDWTVNSPWRSPGSAFVHSPCGVGGGNPYGCPEGGPSAECPGGGYGYGPFAEDLNFENVVTTEWKIGSQVEAYWGIIANHGGGYSYRLCKVPEEGVSAITEECFQETPLRFAGDEQWVQYGEDEGSRVYFVANRTDVGTFPPGSQWAKNPIPACDDLSGGWFDETPDCPGGFQFEPPAPGLGGYGEIVSAPGDPTMLYNIGDLLEIPADLAPGDYVLSWRWDCEQTSQIWNTCSSIRLVN